MKKELVDEKVTRQDDCRDAIPTPCGRGSGCVSEASYNHRGGVNSSIDSKNPSPQPSQLCKQGHKARKLACSLCSTRGEGAYLDNCGTSQSLINSNHFTHLTHSTHFTHFRKRIAFTLAEVLITLGVIGIVAAMTIPNLVQSYKKKVVETKLAKFYSMMNNAIKLAEVDYGPQSTWTDYHIDHNSNGHGGFAYDKGDKIDAVVQKYFAPYLKITGQEDFYDIPVIDNGLNQPQKIYYLSDGSAFSFGLHENREIFFYPFDPKKCLMTEKSPNGRCRFAFAFIPITSEGYDDFKYNKGNGMQPHLGGWDGNEDSLMNSDSFWACNDDGAWCTEIIRRNGWKIPEDYPYKF